MRIQQNIKSVELTRQVCTSYVGWNDHQSWFKDESHLYTAGKQRAGQRSFPIRLKLLRVSLWIV